MAFYNFEGVKAVQKARQEKDESSSDEELDIFMQQVEELFGRSIEKEALTGQSPNSDEDHDTINIVSS